MRGKTRFAVLLGLVLAVSLCVNCVTVSAGTGSEESSTTGETFTESQGINNIVSRAYHAINIPWTPVKDVEGNYTTAGTMTAMYYAGLTYYGIPYGQQDDAGAFVPFDADFDTFMGAVKDSESLFYTARGANNGRQSLYYATDCSAFVSYCYDLPRMKTWNIAKSDLFDPVEGNSIYNAQIGDCFNASSHHVELITDMIYDTERNLVRVEICDETAPQARSRVMTPEKAQETIDDGSYTLLRYKNRDSVGEPLHYEGCYDRTSLNADDSVEVNADNSEYATTFQWSAEAHAYNYELRLWNGKCLEGSPDYVQTTTKTSLSLDLPAGTYEGFLEAKARITAGSTHYYSRFNRHYVKFTVEQYIPLEVTAYPVSASAVQDETAYFTINATGRDVRYQWQYRTSANADWKNLASSSAKTSTYAIKALKNRNGYQFRCHVTDYFYNEVYSEPVTLTVKAPIVINTQPKNLKVKSGKVAKFTVKASGTRLTYIWQYRKNSKSSWAYSKSASGKTKSYALRARKGINGYQMRCLVKDTKGHYLYTKTVKLTVY